MNASTRLIFRVQSWGATTPGCGRQTLAADPVLTELVELVEVPTVAHRCDEWALVKLTKAPSDPAEYPSARCARTHHRTVTEMPPTAESPQAARTRAAS